MFCQGQIQFGGGACQWSYVQKSLAKYEPPAMRSYDSVQRDLDNKIFQYMHLIGQLVEAQVIIRMQEM